MSFGRTGSAPDARSNPICLRNSGLAQSGEISGFVQGADLRHPPRFDGPQARDAGITIVADQPTGLGEFDGGAFGVAFESIA